MASTKRAKGQLRSPATGTGVNQGKSAKPPAYTAQMGSIDETNFCNLQPKGTKAMSRSLKQ